MKKINLDVFDPKSYREENNLTLGELGGLVGMKDRSNVHRATNNGSLLVVNSKGKIFMIPPAYVEVFE